MATNAVGFTVDTPALAMTVTKEQVTSGRIGEPITYRVIVTNSGGATVTSVTVVDTVSPVVVGTSVDQPAGFAAPGIVQVATGSEYTWSAAGLSVQPGTSLTFTVTGSVGFVCGSTQVSNTAYVRAADVCGASASALTNGVGVEVAGPFTGITMVREQDTTGGIGEAITYRVIVTNTGSSTLADIIVVDTVSPVVTGPSASGPAGFSVTGPVGVTGGTRYVWSATGLTILPGTSLTFTVTGTVGSVCGPTSVSNTALVSAGTGCGAVEAAASAVGFVVDASALAIAAVKEEATTGRIGETVTYRIVVTNTGVATITDLTVIDTVSPVVVGTITDQPVGFGVPGIAQAASGSEYTWSASGLNFLPGTSLTFTITGSVGLVSTATQVANTAYAEASAACANAVALTNAVGFTVESPVTDIAIVKSQTPATPGIGDAVTYRIVVTNSGTATLTGLTVVDTIAPVMTGVSTDDPGGFGVSVSQVTGGTRYAWSASGLSFLPGTDMTFTLTGTVGIVCVPTAVSNTACVVGLSACGPAGAVSNVTGFDLPAPPLGIAVVKEQVATGGIGEAVTYRIVVTN
jgi:uncharacterized repeat protein (TIGR01451 family)